MATAIEEREPTPKRILKKVTPYSVGSRSFDQGDACFSITAFDDYVYFSLTEERNGEEVPLDLTGYGSIYLRFKNKDVDISIKSVEEIDTIDPSVGEAVFKVNREDSLKVIASGLTSFAIVSRLDIGDDKSFENVIFQGKFLKPDENTESISRYDRLYNAAADAQIQELDSSVRVLQKDFNDLVASNNVLQTNIDSLSIQFDELDKKYKKVLKQLKEVEDADQITANPSVTVTPATVDAVQQKVAALQRPLPTPSPPSTQEASAPRPASGSFGGKEAPVYGGGVGFNQGDSQKFGIAPGEEMT